MGLGEISNLNQLAEPMDDILQHLIAEREELQRYRDRFGPLPPESSVGGGDGGG